MDEEQERKARAAARPGTVPAHHPRRPLEAVAKDMVDHFLGRGFPGKAMVISIDKLTALRTTRSSGATGRNGWRETRPSCRR